MDDFRRLLPYLKEIETVILEGWGESLLHKNLLECIRLVKREGSQVSFVTSGMGLDKAYVSGLMINAWQDEQKVFSWNGTEAYGKILEEVERKTREWKIELRRPSLSPKDVAVCEENPLRNLYISTDGEVSPCVYLNPPLPSPFKRIFQGEEYQIEKVSFENIFREPLSAIWNHKGYIEFRNYFSLREKSLAKCIFRSGTGKG